MIIKNAISKKDIFTKDLNLFQWIISFHNFTLNHKGIKRCNIPKAVNKNDVIKYWNFHCVEQDYFKASAAAGIQNKLSDSVFLAIFQNVIIMFICF